MSKSESVILVVSGQKVLSLIWHIQMLRTSYLPLNSRLFLQFSNNQSLGQSEGISAFKLAGKRCNILPGVNLTRSNIKSEHNPCIFLFGIAVHPRACPAKPQISVLAFAP